MNRVPSTNVSEEHGLEKSREESLGNKVYSHVPKAGFHLR